MRHAAVLVDEVIEMLRLEEGMHIIDCTLGDAGHAEKILESIGETGKYLGIDVDPEAIVRAKHFLHTYRTQTLFARDNFVHIKKIVKGTGFSPVNGILLDLGWSTPQFEERGRGFSFLQSDEPLDMRFGSDVANSSSDVPSKTAADILHTHSADQLAQIFADYGEEKWSKEIAQDIVLCREKKAIATVADLVEIILQVYRRILKTDKDVPWIGGLHPATKVFQALRITVNNELHVLEKTLPDAIDVLAPKGRLAVITFHSLEDRIVKHYFKSQTKKNIHIITKKPIMCSKEEYDRNPRARSAKLRVIEKI